MWNDLDLALIALRIGCKLNALAFLRAALGKANTECPEARTYIMCALNKARAMP